MPGTWKSDLLLNVILMARVDGELVPMEILLLSRVRDQVGADQRTLADAVLRSYFDRATRIETMLGDEHSLRSMVIMALIDRDYRAQERELIEAFVELAVIPAERVRAIIAEAAAHVDLERDLIINSIDAKYLWTQR